MAEKKTKLSSVVFQMLGEEKKKKRKVVTSEALVMSEPADENHLQEKSRTDRRFRYVELRVINCYQGYL